MIATHPTLTALLEAIRVSPDDDTPRLALAHWHEERGDPALGEFIGVQLELARGGFNPRCPKCNNYGGPCNYCEFEPFEPLQRRESALRAEHEARWRRGEKCERCQIPSPRKDGIYRVYESAGPDSRWVKCELCHGTGWERWWLSQGRDVRDGTGWVWRHRVHWERGFITQVDANLSDIFRDDKPTEWALAVVRGEVGGRRFGVVDRPAYKLLLPDKWSVGGFAPLNRPCLPANLYAAWEAIPGHAESEAAANRALATAAWAIVERVVSGSNGGG